MTYEKFYGIIGQSQQDKFFDLSFPKKGWLKESSPWTYAAHMKVGRKMCSSNKSDR